MRVTSFYFFIFLALLFLGYYTCFRRWQRWVLLFAGLVFYAFSGCLVFICSSVAATWFIARGIHGLRGGLAASGENPRGEAERKANKARVNAKCKGLLILGLIFNFGLLAALKYAGFFISNVNALIVLSGGRAFGQAGFLAPLGISFYTLQIAGYLIDVYRGAEYEPSFFRLALFTTFFPQLIQGPISRYGDLKKDLFPRHDFNAGGFQEGLARILWGLFKKMVVADRLHAAYSAVTGAEYAGVYVLAVMLLYAVTLYADFTGGIDIALGTARALGIGLRENFNRPFLAVSAADFWRRWHISMGAWFKDYVFYPLSTSRLVLSAYKRTKRVFGGVFRRAPLYAAMLCTWFLTGLWHGAEWRFAAWGLTNGAVIVLSEALGPFYKRFHKRFNAAGKAWYRAFQIVRTFCLMGFIRLIDIYGGRVYGMYLSLFTDFNAARLWGGGFGAFGLNAAEWAVTAAAVLVMALAGYLRHNKNITFLSLGGGRRGAVFAALLFAVIIFGVYGFGYDARAFIYTQF